MVLNGLCIDHLRLGYVVVVDFDLGRKTEWNGLVKCIYDLIEREKKKKKIKEKN